MTILMGGRNSNDPSILVSEVALVIPANVWTEIPLPIAVSTIFDFRVFANGEDITSSIVKRRTSNSFEILSLNNLTTTIITQGVN